MGVIKDGTISGNLPSTEAFAVHYPGYPSSTTRVVETLGGSEGILKARSLQSNKLELHFRPEDPYSHPAFGELQPCNNFLLRISKRTDRNGQYVQGSDKVSKCVPKDEIHVNRKSCPQSVETDQVNERQSDSITLPGVDAQFPPKVPDNPSAYIVSRISEAYHFNGMVDYQHVLAVHADAARRKKRYWADIEPQFEKGGLMDMDQEDLMILVPPLFSIKDVPEKVVLKPSLSLSLKKKQKGVVQHHWEMDIEPSLAIDFYIKEIPKKVYWEKYIHKDSEQWEWQMTVCKLFDERPIWAKRSLAERLLDEGVPFGDHTLRRLLFRAAYYFSNGPFLRFWIRKGYDPRKDPESRVYQRIDFRVPPSLRSYDTNVASGLKHRWEDICLFRVFPYKCQTSLQLFELADDYIQQEIRKPPQRATCSCATGWFPSGVLDSLRLCIAVRFLSVYPKAGAESLLKSASERFNKSTRMQIYAKDKRLDEDVQLDNAELVRNEDKEELGGDGDDEDEEEEIDYDNVEEELDSNETFQAGEDVNFTPQPYIDHDSISKNYLQELFGSFPFGEVGCQGLQDADNSDGEYQIYEQFSEGNYSDDDDEY